MGADIYNMSTMSKSGKITIPAAIRKKENFRSGQKFAFLKTVDGLILIPYNADGPSKEALIPNNLLQRVIEEEEEKELRIETGV